VNLHGDDLWENKPLAQFNSTGYKALRCPDIPKDCNTFDVSRAQLRSNAELIFSMQCINSSATAHVAWLFIAALIGMLLMWTQ